MALWVDVSEEKMTLGVLAEIEHHEICEALFRDLERRGLVLSEVAPVVWTVFTSS